MWSKPWTAMGLLMRPEIGAAGLEQKPEDAAVAAFAGLEDVAAQQTLLLEAQALQQRLGAAVAQVGAGRQAAQAADPGEGDHRLHGLLREAVAPGVAPQHE